ncbi:MAG: class I SAM-dependent methyltransferase [Anaerolineae bacterium]|nr:class I SAM-dependent methyltransferase [Anaerolineae bacterium]
MNEFRQKLYSRYVSAFKTEQIAVDEHWQQSYSRWCTHKILPLLTDVPRDAAVLDLGCGPGYFMTVLQAASFQQIRGVDISEEQLAIARQRGLDVVQEDVFTFLQQTKPGTYAAIIALDLVEHFTKPELLDLLELINRALQPGGTLLIQTVNGAGLFPGQVMFDDLTHATILTPTSLSTLLTLSGFTSATFSETGPAPSSWKGVLRIAAWNVIKAVANTVRFIETSKTQTVWTENMLCASRKPPL